jgi:hypothetical protein
VRRAKICDDLPRASRPAPAMLDASGVDEFLLLRGNPTTPGEEVPRKLIAALVGEPTRCDAPGGDRLELAHALTDPAQPLLARVFVNRVWHYLYGRGLVATVDDFGNMGEAPTHPELLDHLSRRFVADGWSLKRLLRVLALSSTYRMGSAPDARAAELDPKNLLWHHLPGRRLTAEELRDAILCTSGSLDPTLYGAPIPVHLTSFMEGRGRPELSGPIDGAGRRSLYLAVRRNFLPPFFLAFDYPPPATTMGRRTASNVPAQALTLMNDPFVAAQAVRWAECLLAAPAPELAQRLDQLWLTAFARRPEDAERSDAASFLAQQSAAHGAGSLDPRPWTDLCHVLLNAKEFLYLR